MKSTFFGRHALLIVCIVCFLVPFSVRGARVSIQSMKNDVTDWLPAAYQETGEIKWFWDHFIGERFIIVSWAGFTGGPDDEQSRLFLEKLKPELPPSKRPPEKLAAAKSVSGGATETVPAASSGIDADAESAVARSADAAQSADLIAQDFPDEAVKHPIHRGAGGLSLERTYDDFLGDKLGLFSNPDDYFNFGNRQEKWLAGYDNQWYFITPDGELFHWKSADTPMAAMFSKLWRSAFGGEVEGEHIASFGEVDGAWYYANPRRLNAQVFKQVTTGPQVLADLTRDGGVLADDKAEAKRRLKGALFGPDGEQTCMILIMTEAGRKNFHRVIGRGVLGKPRGKLFDIAEECGISMEELRLGGPPVDNVAIDEEGSITLVRLVSLSVLLGVSLAYACFRSISATLIVFFVGGISAVSSLAMVGWCNSTLDAILMSMPSLIYVLGISGAVHLINYYREHLELHGPLGAPEYAIRQGWKPAVLCNICTSIGLFSLCASDIVPIRKFGIFAGIAVLATSVLLFTYLPAALQILPQKPRSADRKRREEEPWYEKYLATFWDRLGVGIIKRPNLVAILCTVLITIVGLGVLRINTSVDLLKMFDGKAKILHDYAWLEKNLGKLVPMEIVVKVAPDSLLPVASGERGSAQTAHRYQMNFLDRMLLADRVQSEVDRVFGEKGQGISGRSLSAATFALPSRDRFESYTGRVAINSALQKHRAELLASDYLREDRTDGSELWRISLRIGALQNVDYGEFTSELKYVVEPIMAAYRARELLLRDLEERSGTGGKTRVLLLGAPLVSVKKASEKSEQGESKSIPENTEVASRTTEINQTEIFAGTYRDLLRNARLDVRYHNPATDPIPEQWAETIGKFDYVVLIGDDAKYDHQLIRANAKQLLDARDHVFHNATTDTEPEIAARKAANDKLSVTAVYTGVVPIVYKAQRALLNSLIQSTFWSFITITPLMMFVSRSVRAGLLVMLPNVLPVLVIFGAMGWLGIQVDIGSMMSASIALGVAVDDTIHFLTWFREALDKYGNRKEAILSAYKHCATPTFQAAMISGMGLSIFAFSTFTPTQRFGYLMLSILVAGMVAELIFMPALLAGPLGAVFKPRKKPAPAPDAVGPSIAAAPMDSQATHPSSPHSVAASEAHRSYIMRTDAGHNRKNRE